MTENKIKEILKDIIDNGAEYECRSLCGQCDYKRENCDDTCTLTDRLWNKYHLGDEIRSDYEYRKVELWLVLDSELESNKYICIPRSEYETKRTCSKPYFTGTEIKCKKWIEGHAKKTWLEETLKEKRKSSTEYTHTELDMYEFGCENGIIEVCKKILEEVDKKVVFKDFENYESGSTLCITLDDLEHIIKDLGVEL